MARSSAQRQSPQIISERDPGGDDDDDGPAPNVREVVPEIQNLRPTEVPSIRQQKQAKDETDYVVVETDAKGRPLNGAAAADGDEPGEESVVEQRRNAREADRLGEGEGEDGEDVQNADGTWPDHRSRRRKRREGKERMYAENQRLTNEVEELRNQLETFRGVVEPKLSEIDAGRGREQLANLENQIRLATQEAERAEKAVAVALREGDEDAIVKAMRADKTAFLDHQKLLSAKAQLARNLQNGGDGRQPGAEDEAEPRRQPAPQRRAQAPDPIIKGRADEFLAAHPWIQADKKPKEQDEDTRLALYLDEQVRHEGFDPKTDDYWDELEDRLRRRMPERFERRRAAANGNGAANGERRPAAAANNARRGPPVSGAGESRGNGGRREVRISPERRQAMIDQGTVAADGTIIDQAKFKRTLAKYDEFDRTNNLARS